MAAAKSNTKKISISGPTLKIDNQEVINFTSEFQQNPNMRLLDRDSLENIAMQTHQSFVQSVHSELKKATRSAKSGKKIISKPKKSAAEKSSGEL